VFVGAVFAVAARKDVRRAHRPRSYPAAPNEGARTDEGQEKGSRRRSGTTDPQEQKNRVRTKHRNTAPANHEKESKAVQAGPQVAGVAAAIQLETHGANECPKAAKNPQIRTSAMTWAGTVAIVAEIITRKTSSRSIAVKRPEKTRIAARIGK
jgi:hypothetical protein